MNFTKEQEDIFHDIINALNSSNALENVILVGSWAEYIYEKEQVIQNFNSFAKTMDIDFLINDKKPLNNSKSVVNAAHKLGFKYNEDYITGVSKLYKKDFEIEFLISQNGDGLKKIPKNSMGINAQQLTHIGFVRNHYLTVEHNGYNINIPKPEAYVIQKMIINNRRKEKAEIDRLKIDNLMPFINKNEFQQIYKELFAKERKAIDNYIVNYIPDFIYDEKTIDIINMYQKEQNQPLTLKMEEKWIEYFDKTPKELRKGIEWEGQKLRPAVFDDMYLSQCILEKREPNQRIKKHFWENCVNIQGYNPQFCDKTNITR